MLRAEKSGVPGLGTRQGVRVLVVSTHDMILDLYAALLADWQVETAASAEGVAHALSKGSFDLIVTDTVGCTHELLPPLLGAGVPILVVCDGHCSGDDPPACGIDDERVTCLHWPHPLAIFRSAVRDLLAGPCPRYHWRPPPTARLPALQCPGHRLPH